MIKGIANVGIVVEDLTAVVAFFVGLGMELEGRGPLEGAWVDRCVGLEGIREEVAMLRTLDGQSRLELVRFECPVALEGIPDASANTLGLRRVMFAVDDIDATVAAATALGATLMGEVVQFADAYRLCYLRGPEGLIVALAEELG